MKLRTTLLGSLALLGASMAPAQADIVFTFSQSGDNVVMQASGVLNTANLVHVKDGQWGGVGVDDASDFDAMGDNSLGNINIGFMFHDGTDYSPWQGAMFTKDSAISIIDGHQQYSWISVGTTQFSTYAYTSSDLLHPVPGISMNTNDMVGDLWTPDVTWTTKDKATLASLGMTVGTYTITDAQTKEAITIQIGDTTPVPDPTSVPEPASLAILGMGLLGLCAARRRRQ